jgi:hypothetical protein
MKKKNLVYKAEINWGYPLYVVGGIILLLDAVLIYQLIMMILFNISAFIPFIVFSLPIIILNVILFPLVKSLVLLMFNKKYYAFELYTTGIKIKNKFFKWKEIKGIGFSNGRNIDDKFFYIGKKLPVYQKVFMSDKDGKEYSCLLDIDYYFKQHRKQNNLLKIEEFLLGLDKIDLIGDWAEKK